MPPVLDASDACAEQTATTARIRLEIETNLNFDRLICSDGGGGRCTLRPDGSTARPRAQLTDVSPRAMVGTVTVHGLANRRRSGSTCRAGSSSIR